MRRRTIFEGLDLDTYIICHLVAHEPFDMLRLNSISVLTIHRLPGGVVEPALLHYTACLKKLLTEF